MATIAQPAAETHYPGLRRANAIVGLLHALQAIVILSLATGFRLPVTGAFLDGPPGEAPSRELLFELPIGVAVAVFLALAAVNHLAMAAPGIASWYDRQIRGQRNVARWMEYSLSASLMAALIAMLAGITDVGALIGIFALSAGMIGCGLLMELINTPDRDTRWSPFVLGSVLGAVPWIVIGIVILGAEIDGSVPGFVYGIFFSLFVLFNSFALNMWLQYRRIGRWRDYAYGEAVYLGLSLVAKSLLAWQIFGSTLAA
jgi:hypothetical protein